MTLGVQAGFFLQSFCPKKEGKKDSGTIPKAKPSERNKIKRRNTAFPL